MLTYVDSSIWASPAQTLVNTVNVVGAMGKGIALEFKQRYPEMYKRYRELCREGKFQVSMLWLYRADDRNILNFPTKKHWRHPSKPEYIRSGLEKFVDRYDDFNITSISFPQLGTGHGGLDWKSQVKPLMEQYLKKLPIPVYIHLRTPNRAFVPETLLPVNQAIPFDTLLEDLNDLAGKELVTPTMGNPFKFLGIKDEFLLFSRGKNGAKIPLELLRMLWEDLHTFKLIQSKKMPGYIAKEQALIIALLSEVPYIQPINTSEDYDKLIHYPTKAIMLANKGDTKKSPQIEIPL